ncbi:MAG: FimB/Mfa2 family fimbrial subunit [Tannerellaceae bacterium]|nr:FimB/Mfa2 family fimbrial subunit [Tannerellaceae bacterium]
MKHLIPTLLLTLIISLPSCIHDELEDCFFESRLFLDYRPANYAAVKEGILAENVKQLSLFVFDKEGLFVKEYTDDAPTLNPDYYISLSGLESGIYQMVLWGGLNDNYVISDSLVAGETKIDDLQLLLKHAEKEQVTTTIPHLFYASGDKKEIEVVKNQDVEEKLKLIQNSYTINLTVNGLEETDETYTLTIEDHIRKLDFENQILSSNEKYSYTTVCRKSHTNVITGSLSVLRLTDDKSRNLPFRLSSDRKKEPVFEYDLIELLLSLRTVGGVINFSYMHEFDIVLTVDTFSEEKVTFHVSINGWNTTLEETPL